jgi:geranylgeranyl diphosphate synthase type II
MDNASLRRGMATVHERWNVPVGILSGDLLLIKSYAQLEAYDPEMGWKLFSELNRCAALVCEGQQLDMDYSSRNDVSVSDYLEMIELKTAVLLGSSLKMGAMLAGADEGQCEALNRLGIEAGIAFQLADDLLDAYPVSEKFGKKPGGDIVENKKTYLVLRALTKANEEQKKELVSLLNPHVITEDEVKIEKVTSLFDQLDIPQETRLEAQRRFDQAMELLKGLNCSESAKMPLKALLDLLRDRSF